MNFSYLKFRDRAGRISTSLLAVLLCLASVRSTPAQTTPPSNTVPIRSIIPVVFDGSNGNITIGTTTLNGANPGFHLVALRRQPNRAHPEVPDVLVNSNYTSYSDVTTALANIATQYPDAMIMVNTAGSYGFPVWAIGYKLVGDPSKPDYGPGFGGTTELGGIGYVPLAFIGVVGLAPGTAPVSRWNSTRPITGYLTPDSSANYTFIQTDFVRYDITTDGTIKVGTKTYKAADAPYKPGCDALASNSFHLLVVNRESPEDSPLANNTYCDFSSMANDLSGVTDEGELVFIAANGHPIPANWNFGTNGDGRVVGLAQQVARLGGYWETMAYLTPNDTYSLVGAPPPPSGTKGAHKRARESSSVYPEITAGVRPTGELHGVLARSGRGNWYSPLNADTSGYANLGFYDVLAAPYQPFVGPSGTDEVAAFQYISDAICSGCNMRDLYDDLVPNFNTQYTKLQGMLDKSNKNCDVPGSGADPAFCKIRTQLLMEFNYVNLILNFYNVMNSLWLASGNVTISSQLAAYATTQSGITPPTNAASPSLADPLVNFFLGLASFVPEIGPAFGLADIAFNLGTSLTTDPQGNKMIDLTSTFGNMVTDAQAQFTSQANTTGTLFKLIFQDWGKLSMLGATLASVKDSTSPWYWDTTTTSTILTKMAPAINQAAYQTIMAGGYAIGSYLPNGYLDDGMGWGKYPLSRQPHGYLVEDFRSAPYTPISHPFDIPAYIPFTFPTDLNNQWYNDTRTATLMSDGTQACVDARGPHCYWLGISQLDTPANGTSDSFQYQPPPASTLTLLFNPAWQWPKGLGVYRPAFFHNWPFPRVQCTPVFNTPVGGGHSVGGCNWSAATTPPELLQGVRRAKPSVMIRAVQSSGDQPRQTQIEVMLTIHNNGPVTADSVTIDSLTLQTLGGVGQPTLVSPTTPIQLINLKSGDSITIFLKVNVPATAPRLSITESGTITSGNSRAPDTFKFSEAQSLFLR